MDSKFEPLLLMNEVIKAINKTDNYKKYCQEQVSASDKKLIDFDHCLEFVSMNCVKRTQLDKMRKEELDKRRFFKDELEYINAFENSKTDTQAVTTALKNLKAAYESTKNRLNNRKYTPRCSYELFGITPEEAEELELRKRDKVLLGKRTNNKTLEMEYKFRQINSV